jgi:hypothetical protein
MPGEPFDPMLVGGIIATPFPVTHTTEPTTAEERKDMRRWAFADWTAPPPESNAKRIIARLLDDYDTLVAECDDVLEALRLCQSYASNTSGGMDAETRLRNIYELCCIIRLVRKANA